MEFQSEAKNPISACFVNYINFLARFWQLFLRIRLGPRSGTAHGGIDGITAGLELRLLSAHLISVDDMLVTLDSFHTLRQ